MENVGIIACLKDDEQVLEALTEIYKAVKDISIHPIQYDELCALVFYKASTMVRNGSYLSMTSKNKTMIFKSLGFSLAPVFADWDYEIYARFLEGFWSKWGIKFDDIFVPPDSVRTYLADYLRISDEQHENQSDNGNTAPKTNFPEFE
jgi:hypothetical protein